jgi:menaquinone-9 beta-reductase
MEPRREARDRVDFDVITIGGGIAGASLARAMAQAGHRVLVLERATRFTDRVRGEQLASWGAGEAHALGLYDLLTAHGSNPLHWIAQYRGSEEASRRDLAATTPAGLPNLSFYHPTMQEVVLKSAAEAGAEVRRGALVRHVAVGRPPSAVVEQGGRQETVSARLLVAADGRHSVARSLASFATLRDPDRLRVSGVLFDNADIDDAAAHVFSDLALGRMCLLFPQKGGRVRVYLVTRTSDAFRLRGERDCDRFVELASELGVPEQAVARARVAGPLATFDGAASWVEYPYHLGVALVGDAAGAGDPSWGQGLSLALRDVRVLRDALLANDDWDAAGHAYASAHDHHFQTVHHTEDWFTQLFLMPGSQAEARRARVLPLLAEDGSRLPDTFQSGPDAVTVDEQARRRMFGEAA